MMENKKHRIWVLIGISIVILLCVISIFAVYSWQRSRDVNSHPLVLIHNPANHAVIAEGELVSLHATARSQVGLQRMEFWVDDQLIAEKLSENSDSTNMTLVDVWSAMQPGEYVIIARAVSKNGIDGQATISIKVSEVDVQELTDTAEEGVEIEEELAIPGGEAPESDGPAPLPEDPPPGSLDSLADNLGMDLSDFFGGSRDASPVGLRLELLELAADAFEELHCYIGMGLSPPRWYPDLDSDQSTDESFELVGERSWNVSTHFTGESAPVIFWPQNEPLNASVTCVGITGVGTDALELGTWEENIPMESWTGSTLFGGANGRDGSFSFSYRIERVGAREEVVPMYLDLDMTPPINARLDADSNRLRWDYTRPDDEEPISGFRIYLNHNLQWVEPPDSRASMLPYEWFHPPCGSTYIFSVTAFRYGLPDGPESFPAFTSIHTPEEDCHREIEINFLTLETFDLGGDDSDERKIGDRGPVYGDFIANENSIHFSGGSMGDYFSNLDYPVGLDHYTIYDLFYMWETRWWNTSEPVITVDVPPGGSFEFTYIIKDRDDDSGNDVICDGYNLGGFTDDMLDGVHEGYLDSDNGRCRLTYRFGPAPGSPVGSGVAGEEPRPWLAITDITFLEETGQPMIHLINTGTATWPWKDLQIELQTREGESLGIYTWTEFLLETGESTVVSQPSMVVDPPLDACALVDPNDLLIEFYETPVRGHTPYCPELPDLTIAGVAYGSDDSSLRVAVGNFGEGALENRSVELTIILPDGSSADINGNFSEINLEPGEMHRFFLPGISESVRVALTDGYTVVIDERNLILESDESNNSLNVP